MTFSFGSDATKSKAGKYHELGQEASDSEFSLSDDETVLFKKPGEIELHLYPQTRIHRAKKEQCSCRYVTVCAAILLLVVSLITVVVVVTRFVGTHTNISNGTLESHTDGEDWKIKFEHMSGEGCVRLLDVDGDGMDDIIFASSAMEGWLMMHSIPSDTFNDLHKVCKNMGKEYPCIGNLIALRGLDGKQLWSLKTRSETFTMNCGDFDFNKDGKKDCIATGRMGQIVAFDPYKGEILWTCEDDRFIRASWNTYNAAALPDWNGDGVPEVLLANGGDTTKLPEEHDREAGRLVVLSGATGQPLGTRYLNMPGNKETYMSPVIYTRIEGAVTYILFGSGGETIPGDLMGISLADFCVYILETTPELCRPDNITEYSDIDRDDDGIFIIHRGGEKGVMVPPVVVDADGNGIQDILVTSFDGQLSLYSGKDFHLAWKSNFTGMETYGTPAPGYFDDDDYVDFMVHWNQGVWMYYSTSTVFVISGKDGSILWSLQSPYMQMSSALSISTTLQHKDVFLFKVQGRDSKFRWAEDGSVIRPDLELTRKRRHPELDTDVRPVESRKESFYQGLTCEDDVTSFRGEVFVMDRTTVNNPVKILDIPTRKHTYDANKICSQPQHTGHNPSGHMIPPMDDGKSMIDDKIDHENPDHDHDDLHSTSSAPVTGDSDRHPQTREMHDHSEASNTQADSEKPGMTQMCGVESPDFMSSGIIGDVNGDNHLDYISVTSINMLEYDAQYCQQGMIGEVHVRKIRLEKGLLDGTFHQVSVKSKTSMTGSAMKGVPAQKEKTFLPMNGQRWTQYMGTKGTNVYR